MLTYTCRVQLNYSQQSTAGEILHQEEPNTHKLCSTARRRLIDSTGDPRQHKLCMWRAPGSIHAASRVVPPAISGPETTDVSAHRYAQTSAPLVGSVDLSEEPRVAHATRPSSVIIFGNKPQETTWGGANLGSLQRIEC